MNSPIVSVLMTSYNREKFIAEAIESVLASTLSEFELIIVDDGSTDNTVSIARQYEERDKRIRVYINETNLGDYPNRNKAAGYAKGKYLKYVDSDDKIYTHCLQVMTESMEKFPEATWGIMGPPEFNFNRTYPFRLMPQEIFELSLKGARLLSRAPLSMIFRRDCFEKEKGFLSVRQWGDAEFSRRLALQYPVVLFTPGLAWYRQHEGQENAINSVNKKFVVIACNAFITLLKAKKNTLDEDLKNRYIRQQRRKQRNAVVTCLKQFQLRRAAGLIKLILLNVQR